MTCWRACILKRSMRFAACGVLYNLHGAPPAQRRRRRQKLQVREPAKAWLCSDETQCFPQACKLDTGVVAGAVPGRLIRKGLAVEQRVHSAVSGTLIATKRQAKLRESCGVRSHGRHSDNSHTASTDHFASGIRNCTSLFVEALPQLYRFVRCLDALA